MTRPQILGIVAAGLLLVLVAQNKDAIVEITEDLGKKALDAANYAYFLAAIPSEARDFAAVILQVAEETNTDPFLIVALGQRESNWGVWLSPKGPGGRGDAGHGYGLLQIDDRTWGAWLATNDWSDPYTNISFGVGLLRTNMTFFAQRGYAGQRLVQLALAAYNAGPSRVLAADRAGKDPDSVTTGQNYGADVLARVQSYMTKFSV